MGKCVEQSEGKKFSGFNRSRYTAHAITIVFIWQTQPFSRLICRINIFIPNNASAHHITSCCPVHSKRCHIADGQRMRYSARSHRSPSMQVHVYVWVCVCVYMECIYSGWANIALFILHACCKECYRGLICFTLCPAYESERIDITPDYVMDWNRDSRLSVQACESWKHTDKSPTYLRINALEHNFYPKSKGLASNAMPF